MSRLFVVILHFSVLEIYAFVWLNIYPTDADMCDDLQRWRDCVTLSDVCGK